MFIASLYDVVTLVKLFDAIDEESLLPQEKAKIDSINKAIKDVTCPYCINNYENYSVPIVLENFSIRVRNKITDTGISFVCFEILTISNKAVLNEPIIRCHTDSLRKSLISLKELKDIFVDQFYNPFNDIGLNKWLYNLHEETVTIEKYESLEEKWHIFKHMKLIGGHNVSLH